MFAIPNIKFVLVDVRDVADAHLKAIQNPEAAGHRFALVSESIWF